MGINIECIEESFCCSYSYWNKIRSAVITATFEYLQVHLSLNQLDEECLNETIYRKEILEFIDNFIKIDKYDNEVNIFSTFCDSSKLNILIYYNIGGLYYFCNKSDCDGYYSVGNSYDICELFKLIKPFLIKNKEYIQSIENDIYNSVIKIENVFEESVEKNKIVVIS